MSEYGEPSPDGRSLLERIADPSESERNVAIKKELKRRTREDLARIKPRPKP